MNKIGEMIGFLTVVAAPAGLFAALVWLVASLTPASLDVRWQVTGVSFVAAYVAFACVLGACALSSSISQDEEGRW